MSPHTPGPWRSAGGSVYLDRDGLDMLTVVAKCPRRQHSPVIRKADAEANAAFIARACNAHEDLLAALEFAYLRLSVPDREIIGPAIRKATAP